jgi:hypothetical protein
MVSNIRKNSFLYIIGNMGYLIPGTLSALVYFNFFYDLFVIPDFIIPRSLDIITFIVFGIPYLLFYFMGLTFTILLYPIGLIILLLLRIKNISRICIIYTIIHSSLIAFVYIYLIWGKGLYLTV